MHFTEAEKKQLLNVQISALFPERKNTILFLPSTLRCCCTLYGDGQVLCQGSGDVIKMLNKGKKRFHYDNFLKLF